MRRYDPVEVDAYIARVLAPRGGRRPRFDVRGLGRVLQFVLQTGHDARLGADASDVEVWS